jgi:putative phosphoesterase
MRIAALADVHGNVPALEAVLADVERERVDAIVFCGDLTWGPQPRETLALVRSLQLPTHFVRGNCDRYVGVELEGRGAWIAEQHDDDERAFVNGFPPTVPFEVDGLGATLFCHGSPRNDEECVTERTPPERVHEFMAGVDARVVVTGHVHVSYDRIVDGIRMLSPGSVGLPFEGPPGAYWALLGPDVEHRRTDYDLERAVGAYRASGLPEAEELVEILLRPPPRDEVIADAEEQVFAG